MKVRIEIAGRDALRRGLERAAATRRERIGADRRRLPAEPEAQQALRGHGMPGAERTAR